jgi:transposase
LRLSSKKVSTNQKELHVMTTTPTQCTANDGADDGHRLYLAFDLSASTWKLAFATAPGETPRIRTMTAGDLDVLDREIIGACLRFHVTPQTPVWSCYEAGRDGFWLHRALTARGVTNVVVDPSSIETPRRARQVKTDRVDVQGLLKRLMRIGSGERVWSTVRVPTEAEEDRRQLHREMTALGTESTRLRNQIGALLMTQGVATRRVPVRHPDQWAAALRRRDGSPLLPGLQSRIERDVARLQLVRAQVAALEHARSLALRAPTADPALAKARALMALKGLGETAAWVTVMEVFGWRRFRNRREVASLLGLAPTPFASGQMLHEQGISKAGNPRLRALMIELAWIWLRYQPQSALAHWFETRFAHGGTRQRRIGIVAVARRLWIDLWRYLETGVLPEGAELKVGLRG